MEAYDGVAFLIRIFNMWYENRRINLAPAVIDDFWFLSRMFTFRTAIFCIISVQEMFILSPGPQNKCQVSTFNYAATVSFKIPYDSQLSSHSVFYTRWQWGVTKTGKVILEICLLGSVTNNIQIRCEMSLKKRSSVDVIVLNRWNML